MARSKFERQLSTGLRKIGFSIKIPDAGRSHKPFDYVLGLHAECGDQRMIRFLAIEAKAATGWVVNRATWQDHQRKALDLIESIAPLSAWVAVGFLDIPKMSLTQDRKPIGSKKTQAWLIPWRDYKRLERKSVSHKDIADLGDEYSLVWDAKNYAWIIPGWHPVIRNK